MESGGGIGMNGGRHKLQHVTKGKLFKFLKDSFDPFVVLNFQSVSRKSKLDTRGTP